MLELKNITKTYSTGGTAVNALNNVSVNFRNSEFVAVLGHSGSGKTTLLNVIGGLDRYDRGNLIINCRSTAEYNDSDWDSYRNHSIGFVFQSYNLIPHQSVLSNVELALTLSGVSKAERRKRAKDVLERVGLGDQLNKKPNQLSGGQMQRVAIARALINNPEILLADEPTGALDSETSVQIMELIGEIAKDKLVIMVTHNPDLAEQYASRIISLRDGHITSDTNPFTDEECDEQVVPPPRRVKKKTKKNGAKTSMGFGTALSLSFNNLLTKKGRTFLTSFAGSIGIIGIALIMSLSNGMQAYIDSIEKDTLSSFPLTIESENLDMSDAMDAFTHKRENDIQHENDKIYRKNTLKSAIKSMTARRTDNDLAHFKSFIDSNEEIKKLTSDIKYSYDVSLNIYKADTSNGVFRVNPSEIFESLSSVGSTGGIGVNTDIWEEMIGDEALLNSQYEMLEGNWPKSKNELVLFLDSNNEISDFTLYSLGIADLTELLSIFAQANEPKNDNADEENPTQPQEELEAFEYKDFLNIKFKLINSTDIYKFNGKYWDDMSKNSAYMKSVVNNGLELKIVGIARAKSSSKVEVSIGGSIGYLSELTEYAVNGINASEIAKQQKADPKTDVFTGLPFEPKKDDNKPAAEESTTAASTGSFAKPQVSFLDKSSVKPEVIGVEKTAEAPTEDSIYEFIDKNYSGDKEQAKSMVKIALKDIRTANERRQLIDFFDSLLKKSGQSDVTGEQVYGYLQLMNRETKLEMISMFIKSYDGGKLELPQETTTKKVSKPDKTNKTDKEQPPKEPEIVYSPYTYEDNIKILGAVDIGTPSSIDIYPLNFEAKEKIKGLIDEYNNEQKNNGHSEYVIGYTDYVSLIMTSVTQIIDLVTYALIAFVAISLIVSSIMIGVITYISVLERTKEIGILRSIGASKRDISHVFNSETVIVGLVSGVLGVLLALLLLVPINAIINAAAGIANLAVMPIYGGLALIAISVLLTTIAGLIPSRVAAKKDPVIALRTE